MAYDFEHLRAVRDGVAYADVDNPPINLMTVPLMLDLLRFGRTVGDDADVRVVVLASANPEFFIAHFDVEAILAMPTDQPVEPTEQLSAFHAMCERFRTMPKATIAKIAGRVGGGGSELAASFDMRFGALGQTVVNQMEVALGILPGGTGTQRLPRLIGRGRALEMILGCDDIDASTAAEWGYLNRAMPSGELDAFVERLARRIASFSPMAIALAKQSILNAEPDWRPGLLQEAFLFQRLLGTSDASRSMRRFLAIGGQTRDPELRMASLCAELAEGDVRSGTAKHPEGPE